MSAGELSFGAPQSGVLSFGIVSRRPLVLLDDGRMSEMPFGETLQPATMPPDTTSWANLPGMPAVIAAGADAAAARAAIGAAAASGGDVVGPASATDGMVAAFDGATGKLLKAVTLTNTDVGAAPVNTALTDAAASSTLPATTSTALTALLQTVRNCLKWLLANTVQTSGAQTVAGVKTFSDRSAHAGAYTPSLTPAHSATPTFDCATGNVFEPAAMTGNVTSITLSNAVAGQTVQIRFQQDATGGRTCAVPSGAKVDGSINTAADRVSWLILTYSSRGSRWEGNWLVIPS